MNKVYNTRGKKKSQVKWKNFYQKLIFILERHSLKLYIGIILSKSSVTNDIAKHLKDDFSLVQFDSVIKRIKRFFKNKSFNPYEFYN